MCICIYVRAGQAASPCKKACASAAARCVPRARTAAVSMMNLQTSIDSVSGKDNRQKHHK